MSPSTTRKMPFPKPQEAVKNTKIWLSLWEVLVEFKIGFFDYVWKQAQPVQKETKRPFKYISNRNLKHKIQEILSCSRLDKMCFAAQTWYATWRGTIQQQLIISKSSDRIKNIHVVFKMLIAAAVCICVHDFHNIVYYIHYGATKTKC